MRTLYLVATPIGNLEDITLRALRILKEASLIAAEDTRKTRRLLEHYGIHTPMTSYYEHNKMAKLGYLYLHNGTWDGKQIVSGEWVRTATRKHVGTDSQLGYGYQWWIYPSFGASRNVRTASTTLF
jgi:siroheme synthase